jgi:hypothetical protein
VVHRGEDLPELWQSHLKGKRYLRNSDVSPKQMQAEFINADKLLDHTAQSGQFRIFNALPQGEEEQGLVQELRQMRLKPEDAHAWLPTNPPAQNLTPASFLALQLPS